MTAVVAPPEDQVVYQPREVVKYAKKQMDFYHTHAHKAIEFPIPLKGKTGAPYVPPIMPGQVAIVSGQTSNGKSYMGHYWEQFIAERLASSGDRSYVVSVSTEEPIEEIGAQMIGDRSGFSVQRLMQNGLGKNEWDMVAQSMDVIEESRIIRIGHAHSRDYGGKMPPPIHTTLIFKALERIQKYLFGYEIEISAIFLDYLQTLALDTSIARYREKSDQRRLQVNRDISMLRWMGYSFKAPVVVLSQAKTDLKAPKDMYLPDSYDAGAETSEIGKQGDRVFAQWLPKTTKNIGEVVNFNGYVYEVTEDLCFFKVVKQRNRLPAGQIWECRLDYETGGYKVIRPVDIAARG